MGESLLLAPAYAVMDFLFTLPDARQALRFLPWVDAKVLLMRDAPKGLRSESVLWHITETDAPARARWLPREEISVAGDFRSAVDLRGGEILRYEQLREERFRVSGDAPSAGWVVVANSRFPGWQAFSDGAGSDILPALTAFQRVAVDKGPIRLEFVYRPWSAYLGILITTLVAAGLGFLGWRRAVEKH